MFRPRLPSAPLGVAALGVAALGCTVLISCAGSESDADYCVQLRNDEQILVSMPSAPAEVDAALERYRWFRDHAPAAIEGDWQVVTAVIDGAAALDLTDPSGFDEFARQVYSSEVPARRIAEHASETCDLDGILAAMPPEPTLPPTVPPTDG